MTQFASTLYPQTNPSNQILLAFRAERNYYPSVGAAARDWLSCWAALRAHDSTFRSATLAQKHHALRVVRRLARFSG